MKKKKIIALTVAVMMAAIVSLTGCGSSSGQSGQSSSSGDQTLNLSLQDITTLSSLHATDSYSLTAVGETMEGLTRTENDGNKDIIKPAGAEKWDVSKDGLTWTFHLRDNKWSDGKPVTAGDYSYAWLKILDPKTAAEYANFIYCVKGAEDYNKGKAGADKVGIKAIDDKTFEVTLKQPTPYFQDIVGFKSLMPLRKDIVEAQGDKYGQDPSKMVYCGPFKVQQWVKGSKLILQKNDKYWDAKSVKLQTVNLINIPEAQTEMKMFQSKQIDAVKNPDSNYYPQLKQLAGQKTLSFIDRTTPETRYVVFNYKDKQKLFTNAKIRQAFSITIGRETLLKNVYKDYMTAYGWIPNSVTAGTTEYRKQVPEPIKAIMGQDPKKLFQEGLKELGMNPNGKYTVTFLQSGSTAIKKSLSEYYQNVWQAKLGVTVKIDVVADFATLDKRCMSGDYQITTRDWVADFNDPISFFGIFRSDMPNPNNTALYDSKEYNTLVEKMDTEMDAAKRLEYMKQAEELLVVKDCAVAPVYYGTEKNFTQKYVKGLQYPQFGGSYEFKYATVEGK